MYHGRVFDLLKKDCIYSAVNIDLLLMITLHKWHFLAVNFLTDCSTSSLISGTKKTE